MINTNNRIFMCRGAITHTSQMSCAQLLSVVHRHCCCSCWYLAVARQRAQRGCNWRRAETAAECTRLRRSVSCTTLAAFRWGSITDMLLTYCDEINWWVVRYGAFLVRRWPVLHFQSTHSKTSKKKLRFINEILKSYSSDNIGFFDFKRRVK